MMLWQIVRFEIRYWLRSWMLWIFLLIISAMIFGAASTDQITVGDSLSNTYRNAPFVIENFYAIVGLLALIYGAAFVTGTGSASWMWAGGIPMSTRAPHREPLRQILRVLAGGSPPLRKPWTANGRIRSCSCCPNSVGLSARTEIMEPTMATEASTGFSEDRCRVVASLESSSGWRSTL